MRKNSSHRNTFHTPTSSSLSQHTPLRQAQPKRQHLGEVRRAETSDWVPARSGRKARCTTALVTTGSDVVEDPGVGICGRVDEADGALTDGKTLLIYERENAAQGGGRCGSAVDQAERAVNGDDIVCAVGRDVGVTASLLAVVEAVGTVRWWMVAEPALDSVALVAGEGEEQRVLVGKSAMHGCGESSCELARRKQ